MRLLQDWLSQQAQRRPDAAAIRWRGEEVTYGGLEQLSNRLAWMLKAQGCVRGDRVALLLPKSPLAIASMLGVLKADCIYTPVDTRNPAARIARMLAVLGCRCALAVGSTRELLREVLCQVPAQAPPVVGLLESEIDLASGEMQFGLDDIASCPAESPDRKNTSRDTAHILFTSGSTGAPKGVVITHANVMHFVDWAVGHFGIGPDDRLSGHSPLHFDLSTFDLYGTLAAGATLHLIPPETNLLPHKLAQLIQDEALTQWFSVPSILNHMAKLDVIRPAGFPSLRRLLWCGERFPTPGLMYWMRRLPNVEFTNLYGPTEATIASSYYQVPDCPADERDEIPIGTGCAGDELLVLDELHCPVEQGVIGDLYIRGPGLSPGYWADPERTSATFTQDPFSNDPNDRLYRTGDLARVDQAGRVMLVGRADTQVKIRGYRIELGEIETALDGIVELQESAVVVVASAGFEGHQLCCAYVPRPGGEITPAILRGRLAESLPGYMLPSRWKQLERLPLNQNGKTDRPALRGLWLDD